MAANQVDFKILPSDQFSVYSPATRSDKVITYFTLLSKLRGDILSVGQDDDPNDIVSAFYSSVGGTQTLHLVKADGSEVTASVPEPTVGTVTSVDLTASTGISVSGGPITTSGSITVTNTAPDQVVVLTGAGTTSISGTYPSFTITSNDQFVGTVTSVAALTLGTTGTDLSSTVVNGTTTPVITLQVPTASATNRGALSSTDWTTFNSKQGAITLTTTGTTGAATFISNTLNIPNYADQFVGTVTSVNMSVPTGFAISGNPITTSGTLAVAFAAGYSLPTNASQATWDTAYNDSITAFAYNTSTGALTLTQQDAGTLTATVTLQPFTTSNLTEGTNLYYTDVRARLALGAGTGISYNTTTGVITNSAPDQTVVLTAGTGITTSGTYPSFTITNSAPDQTVVLTAGTGISTSGTYPSFTITNSAPDQVVSLTGAGTTTITGTYPNFTISSDDQYDGTVTSVNLTAGTGITVSGGPVTTSGSITVTNNDRGSSQNIFKNFAVAGQSTIVADTNDDTLTIVAGSGVTLTTNDTTDTLTISASGSGGTVTSVGTSAPLTGGPITATGTIGITQSGVSTDGYLSSTDWNTFNSKEPALTKGNLTEATSSVLTITGGTGAVIGSGTTIQVSQAGASASGFLSSTDWNTFNNKQGTITLTTTGSTGAATFISNTLNIPNYADQFVGTVTSVAALTLGTTGTDLSSSVVNSTTTPVITLNVPTASATNRGALSSADWTTFNSKEPALTKGNLTEATSAVLTITGGTGAVIGTGTSIQVAQSGASTSGFLSSTDWNTFNGKASNSFTTIAVATQTSIVADSATDTLTIVAGTGVTITTNDSTDTLTISATGSGGTVTSVDLTAGTGISVSGGPITTSGSITVTNTAPDQTVVLTAGTGISTSGTYPNFTVTNSDPDQTVVLTASTGITTSGTYPNFTIANSAPDQTVVLTGGTGITTSGTYPSFTVTNSAPDQTVVLTAGTGITTSGTYPNFTVTNAAPDQTVAITAGTGISVSGTYPNFTVTNSSPSSGGTVTSVAALTIGTTGTDLSSTVVNGTTTPIITLQVPTASATNRGALSSTDWTTFNNKQGTITLTTTGSTGAATFISNTLNIPNYTDQFVGTVTSVDLTAGTGITVSGGPITTSGSITVNNSDRGSSQNIFKNINVITSQDWDDSDFVWNVDDGSWSGGIDQEAIVADNNNDTLFIESVGGISITTDSTTDTIYFDNIDKGSEQNIFKNFAVSGQSTIVADLNDDTLTVASGTGISLTTNASTDTLTITNSAPDQTVVLTAGTGISTSGTYPNFTITNSSPNQTVSLTGAGTTSISGSYPNFTITSNDQYVGTVTSVGLTAGTGITISGGPITSSGSITVTNDDRGSSQNIFKNIAVTGQSDIVADTNNDTLTVAAGTGISITTNSTTDTLTITNTAASLNPKTESINIRATVPYTVVTPFDDVVIDTVDVKRNAPNTVTSTSKLLAIVTLEVNNTGSIGFTGFTLRLFNQTTSTAVTNTTTKWSAYMYPAATEFGFTSFTYHIPIDDTSITVSDPIQLQLQLEVGTCNISIANFTLMSISK